VVTSFSVSSGCWQEHAANRYHTPTLSAFLAYTNFLHKSSCSISLLLEVLGTMKVASFITLILLASVAVKLARADKVFVSQGDNSEQKRGDRFLKKKKNGKGAKSKGCSANCYNAANSAAFIAALTNVANYQAGKPLELNICPGATITIPNSPGGYYGGEYVINLPPTPTCTKYPVIIRCCGGPFTCGLRHSDPNIADIWLFNFGTNPYNGATLSLTLDSVSLSSENYLFSFFHMPTQSEASNCFNTFNGPVLVKDEVEVPFALFD